MNQALDGSFPVLKASSAQDWAALQHLEHKVLHKSVLTNPLDCECAWLVAGSYDEPLAGLFYGFGPLDRVDTKSPLSKFCVWQLWSVAAASTHQRAGLGSALVEQALNHHLQERPTEPLFVLARWQSQNFYRKHGFEAVGYPLYRSPGQWRMAMAWQPSKS